MASQHTPPPLTANANKRHHPARLLVLFQRPFAVTTPMVRQRAQIWTKTFNQALDSTTAPQHLRIKAMRATNLGNLVLFTKSPSVATDFLPYQEMIAQAACSMVNSLARVTTDEKWYKVAIDGVQTMVEDEYTTPQMLLEEIRESRPNLRLFSDPAWASREEDLMQRETGTVVLALTSQDDANTLIREGLSLFGWKHKICLFEEKARVRQCENCWAFSHSTP